MLFNVDSHQISSIQFLLVKLLLIFGKIYPLLTRVQVKGSKTSSLVHEYELFKMNENESIDALFICFTNIINTLHSFDKVHTNQELNHKIL